MGMEIAADFKTSCSYSCRNCLLTRCSEGWKESTSLNAIIPQKR